LIWTALALLTTLAVTGFSYLFAWPALAAAGALIWHPGGSVVQHNLCLALVAAPALLLTIPAIDVFFLMAQPRPGNPDSEIPSVVAAALLLALLVIALLWTAWPHRRPETDLPNP
jgi:hypothetical protein